MEVCREHEQKNTLSPTVYLLSTMPTTVIYYKEDRYVATIDITNFFIQTRIDRKPVEYKIIMKINRIVVNILVQMDPGKYGSNIVHKKGKKVI